MLRYASGSVTVLQHSFKHLYGSNAASPKTSVCLVDLRSLKMECEKLAGEKTEMQRHYVMVSPRCRFPLMITITSRCGRV